MTGAMIIDLEKSALKRAGKKIAAALSWQGWNDTPEGELHPKGPDGRWVDDHPSVGVFGGAHEHLHELSDKDLEAIDQHVGALTTKLTEERARRKIYANAAERESGLTYNPARTHAPRMTEAERRQSALNRGRTIEEDMGDSNAYQSRFRELGAQTHPQDRFPLGTKVRHRRFGEVEYGGVDRADSTGKTHWIRTSSGEEHMVATKLTPVETLANPAKPLRAARKPKVDLDSVRSEWDAAVNRPMPSDRERFKDKLSGLTVKQLEELVGEKLYGRDKDDKIDQLIEHKLGFRLNSEAIRHGHSSGSGRRTERDIELERINTAMDEAEIRDDRAEYGRLHEKRLRLDRELERAVASPGSRTALEGRPASGDRPTRQSGDWEGSTSPTKVGAGKAEVTPTSMANARAQQRAQAKVDRIKAKLAAAEGKSREEQRNVQSDDEVRLRNELQKAELELRQAKQRAGTLPDTRGNANASDIALLARGTTPQERAGVPDEEWKGSRREPGFSGHAQSASSGSFDIADKGHREARIKEITQKINVEEDEDLRAMWIRERAGLATWKPEGSRTRPKEPFMYEGESSRRAQERHQANAAAAAPAHARDQSRAEEVAGQINDFLSARRMSNNVTDEQILEIVQRAKLNSRALKLLADELGVDFSPKSQFDHPIRTKGARERYLAATTAGSHRRNPSGRTSWR